MKIAYLLDRAPMDSMAWKSSQNVHWGSSGFQLPLLLDLVHNHPLPLRSISPLAVPDISHRGGKLTPKWVPKMLP